MASFVPPIPVFSRSTVTSSVSLTTDVLHHHSLFTSTPLPPAHRRRAVLRRSHSRTVVSALSGSSADGSGNDSPDNVPKFNPNQPPPGEDTIRRLIVSTNKGEQQRGLIYVRSMPPSKALELYLTCLKTTNNEFIRATVAVAIGEIDLSKLPEQQRSSAVNLLIDLLATAEDYGVRSAAAAGMGYATTVFDQSVQQYVAMVESLSRAMIEEADWQVQFSCIASLGVLGKSDPDGVHFDICGILTPWLKSDNDLITQATVGALGDLGNAKVLPDLLLVLGNKDMMTRQRLAQALGNISGCSSEPAAIDALRTLSKDQSFVVRQAATDALLGFGIGSDKTNDTNEDEVDRLVAELEKGFGNLDGTLDSTFIPDGDSETDENSQAAQTNDDNLISKEVDNLMKGDETGNAVESASDALRRRLERSFSTEWSGESHPTMKNPTSFDYRSILTPNTDAETSVSSQGESKEENREEEEVVLSTDKEALAEVIKQIENGDDKEKLLAVIELRKFDKGMARDVVVNSDLLNVFNQSFRLRSLCMPVIGRAGDVELLVHTLRTDPEENVRSACIDSLTDALENYPDRSTDEVVNACIECLQTDDHWLVRISAAIALGSIGKGVSKVEDALVASMTVQSELPPVHASTVRRHVITALGFIGSTKAVKLFEDLLRSQLRSGNSKQDFVDPAMRYRIAAALSGIETKESLALARTLANDKEKYVADMAQATVDALAKKGLL